MKILNFNRVIGTTLKIHKEVFDTIQQLGIDKTEAYYKHLVLNSYFKTIGDRNKAIYRVDCVELLKMVAIQ